MQYVALGKSTKEIADFIQLSDLTVNQYIKSAIKKCSHKIVLKQL